MPDEPWSGIMGYVQRLYQLFLPILQAATRVAVVGAVLCGAWYAFMWLVVQRPIDTTAALVMTWVTAALLLVAMFPQAIDRIKRLKFKDFELELQESVAQSASADFILPSDIEYNTLFGEKEGPDELVSLIRQADAQPKVPVVLVVNVQSDEGISVSMLYTYVLLLDAFSLSTIVLFVGHRQRTRHLSDIAKHAILGVVSGKKVLWAYYRRFPALLAVFGSAQESSQSSTDRLSPSGIPSLSFIRSLYDSVRRQVDSSDDRLETRNADRSPDRLSEADVAAWFKGVLSSRSIDIALSGSDRQVLLSALEANDDFVLLLKDGYLESIITLCELTSRLTKRALAS